jgi:hypothetical protein
MLLFKVGVGYVKEAHEWLGLAFVIACVLHVIRNWRATKNYFSVRAFWVTSLVVAAITLVFVLPSGAAHGGRGNPMFAVVSAVTAAPIEHVAPVLGSTPEDLMARFEQAGIKVEGPHQTLDDLANKSGRRLPEIINVAVAASRPG